jgi:hypothetical protein
MSTDEPNADLSEDLRHPANIPGYDYGTPEAARSPLTLDDLGHLKEVVGLTDDDEAALAEAAGILTGQADAMVTAWRDHLGTMPWMIAFSGHPDGTPNPEYRAASQPRFDRWIIDACTRPLDQAWLDYQEEIGLRHTRAKKNVTDHADSLDHIPLRYLLAFTATIITSSRDYLAKGASGERLDALHAAFTKSVMLHVTVWTRPFVPAQNW